MFSTNRIEDNETVMESLMQELGTAQGYSCYDNNKNSDDNHEKMRDNNKNTNETKDDKKRSSSRLLLLPELDEYPNSSRLVGNHEIWNPYVSCRQVEEEVEEEESNNNSNIRIPLLSTNPQIEVIRRRAYEKFKQSCYQLLQEQLEHSQSQAVKNRQQKQQEKQQQQHNQNKYFDKKLNSMIYLPSSSIPSFFEKFHMDSKLQEYLQLVRQQQKQQPTKSKSPILQSTNDIYRQYQLFQQQASSSSSYWMDPILLSKRNVQESFSKAYRQEIIRACNTTSNTSNTTTTTTKGEGEDEIVQVVLRSSKFQKLLKKLQKAIYKFTCDSHQYFLKELTSMASKEALSHHPPKPPKIRIPLPSLSSASTSNNWTTETQQQQDTNQLVSVTHIGLTFQIHVAHYIKLQRLFDRTVTAKANNNNNNYRFEDALFCILCRYDTLQGAGLQAAIPGTVMDVLLTKFSCSQECFASPFNTRYETYHSIFGEDNDIDSLFGSIGNFFNPQHNYISKSSSNGSHDQSDIGHCYQANPPFCEQVISQLCIRIRDMMTRRRRLTTTTGGEEETSSSKDHQQNQDPPLMFVVIVPVWNNSMAYQQLLTLLEDLHGCRNDTTETNKHHLILRQGHHWYAEGTQYRRSSTFRLASFDTSIFFFQNEKAMDKWPLTNSIFEELEIAFSTDPHESNNNKPSMTSITKKTMKKKTGKMKKIKEIKAAGNSGLEGKDPVVVDVTRTKTAQPASTTTTNAKESSSASSLPLPLPNKPSPELQNTASTTLASSKPIPPPVDNHSRKKKRMKLSHHQHQVTPADPKEEGKAQLRLLQSLGLGGVDNEKKKNQQRNQQKQQKQELLSSRNIHKDEKKSQQEQRPTQNTEMTLTSSSSTMKFSSSSISSSNKSKKKRGRTKQHKK